MQSWSETLFFVISRLYPQYQHFSITYSLNVINKNISLFPHFPTFYVFVRISS